eukprot:1194574-Prorocentrum_minimum.AAC.12
MCPRIAGAAGGGAAGGVDRQNAPEGSVARGAAIPQLSGQRALGGCRCSHSGSAIEPTYCYGQLLRVRDSNQSEINNSSPVIRCERSFCKK